MGQRIPLASGWKIWCLPTSDRVGVEAVLERRTPPAFPRRTSRSSLRWSRRSLSAINQNTLSRGSYETPKVCGSRPRGWPELQPQHEADREVPFTLLRLEMEGGLAPLSSPWRRGGESIVSPLLREPPALLGSWPHSSPLKPSGYIFSPLLSLSQLLSSHHRFRLLTMFLPLARPLVLTLGQISRYGLPILRLFTESHLESSFCP